MGRKSKIGLLSILMPLHTTGTAICLLFYLSGVAPDYTQPIQTTGYSTGNLPAMEVAWYVNADDIQRPSLCGKSRLIADGGLQQSFQQSGAI